MNDKWTDALRGDDESGPEDARIIRAIVRTRTEITAEGIDAERLATAKASLLTRLREEQQADDKSGKSTVDRPRRRGPQSWSLRQTGMLMAAGAAIIAVGILTISNRDTSGRYDPIVIASYAEIDAVRGLQDSENRMIVDNPDAYGRMLAGQLTEQEIPFVLLRENEDATDRILKVQLDGYAHSNLTLYWLRELGISDVSTSVVVIRLTVEEGP